jgi:hypothetical protein
MFWARQQEEEVVAPTTAPYTGHRAATIAGLLTVAAGAMHFGITFLAYRPVFRLTALWFAGAGIAIALIGILTLFVRYTPAGSVDRWVAGLANLAGLVIAIVYEMLSRWSEPRGYVQIVLFLVGGLAVVMGGKPAATADPARPPV